MKFSKLLTTAMMSVALVVSSSAFAAEETPWWSMNFDGLTVVEGSSLTNTLNTAYGTDQNGAWSTEEGDLSELVDNKLKLNTQGTDLTWTPNGDNDETAITYIDADVTFVGSDTAPTISETDVHTAVYLKNIINDETGKVASSVLCAWVKTADGNDWVELTGATVKDNETYKLRIMLESDQLSFYIDGTLLQDLSGETKLFSAKVGAAGEVNSVSFRGTGFVDNFAASQEEAAVIENATIVGAKVFLDNVDKTSEWDWQYFLSANYNGQTLSLDGKSYLTVTAWNMATQPTSPLTEFGSIAAIKLVSDTESFEIVYDDETGFSSSTTLSVTPIVEEWGTKYEVYVDTDELDANAEYTLEFYYGEYTPSEEPDPVQLGTPSVTATTTANSVTLTWDVVANATGYEVTFNNGTPETVTDLTFTASGLTASTDYSYSVVAKGDGENYADSVAATGTATTATPAEPEPEFAPVAVAAIAIDGTTATLTIEGEYTEVKVLFCETLGGEWVEVEATFADGVATVPATTATGFFKVEAK